MKIRRLLLTISVSLLLRPALAQSPAEKQQIPVVLSAVNPQGAPNAARGAGISNLIRQQNGQFGSNLRMAAAADVGALVTAFGARCDGVTDDTAAIQAAINAAETASGTIVQFPAARCNISSALVINHSGVSLRGVASAAVQSGFWGTKLKQTNANADIIDIISSNPVTRGVTIEDVYLEGANGTGTGNGIVFVSSSNFQISQFDIERVQVNLVGGDGFLFKGAPTSTGNFQTVTWDAILDHATVFTAGENCFEWLGYTEQMVALHPYCGQAGKDAFHFDNQETSPGSQGIIALTLINPTSGAVSNYHYWMHGAQGVDVISPYNDQKGIGFAYFNDVYNIRFEGEGHSSMGSSMLGFVFDCHVRGSDVGVFIDLPTFGDTSTHHPLSLLNSCSVLDSRFGYRGKIGAGSDVMPFRVSDWDGGTAPLQNNYYALDTNNGVLPLTSLALTAPSSVVLSGKNPSTNAWLVEGTQRNASHPLFEVYNLDTTVSPLVAQLHTAYSGTGTIANISRNSDGAGLYIRTDGIQLAQSGTVSAKIQPDLLTASRTSHTPDVNGTFVLGGVGTLTTTSSTSDSVTFSAVAGITSSSHCFLTPKNASAATNLLTTYVSGITTNTVTITHAGTSGMIYDVFCTANP